MTPLRHFVVVSLVLGVSLLACNLPFSSAGTTPTAVPATDTAVPAPSDTPAVTDTPLPPSPTPLYGDWPLYTNAACGLSLRYPPGSLLTLKLDGNARIYLPHASGTNLQEKYLEDICTTPPAACASPLAEGYAPGYLASETKVLNGIQFTVQSATEGAAGNFYAWEAYSTQQGATCATLTFVLHSTAAANYDPPLAEFDSIAERAIFAEIVSTFAWAGP
ncbi:MAG TPA: hypothetical protein VGA32_01235 [Anaerolineales bacterium]